MKRKLYRPLLISLVAGAIVIFEVQRNARPEAKKEEKRRQEVEEMRQRDEGLAKEVELLRHKVEELEQLAKGQGLSVIFKLKNADPQHANSAKAVS